MKYTPVGVDIAKHLIQVHFINEHTGEVVDKQLRSKDFLTFFSNREPCLIGMEACGGSQHWARELKKRRPTGVAIVAMANKLARTAWAIVAHDRKYDKNHVSIRPY